MADATPTTSKRSDGYANVITAMGTKGDKSNGSGFIRERELTVFELNALYEQSAMAARIVDRLPDDATREGIFLTGTDESVDFASVQSELEDLNAVPQIADAWRWSRLYGGAILIMVVNDGLKMDQPLDLANATKIAGLQLVESPFVQPAGFNPGLGARAFRNPEWYDILVPFGSSKVRKVHRTRVIRFDGVKVPPTRMVEKNGWGPSVLDRGWTELSQLGDVMGYARNLMHNISMMMFKLDGFRKMLCGSEQDEQEARQIVESLMWNADNFHALALDSKDEFSEVSRTVSGLRDLIDEFVKALVRATNMPKTVLLGEQPSGQNANADSEIRSWFDFVASKQKTVLTPVINRLLEVIFRIRANRKEVVPDEWVINYRPLWQPTAQEQADTLLKKAQAAQILMLNGVMSEDEVRADLISAGLITEMKADDGSQGE